MIDRNRRGVCSRPLALMLLVAASCAPAPMDAGSPDRSRMGGNGAGSGNAGSLGSSSGTGGSSGGSALGPAGSNGSAGSSGQGTVGGTGGSGSSAGSNTGSGTGSTGTSGGGSGTGGSTGTSSGGSGTGGSTGTTSGGGTGSGSTTGSNGGTQPSGGNPGGGQQGGGDPSGGQQGGGDPGGGQQGGGDPSGGQPGGGTGTGTGTGGGQTGAMQCNSIGQVGSAFTPRASSGARSEQARGGMIEEGTYAVTSFSLNRVSDPSQLGFANVRMTGTVRFTASTMEQVLTTETGAGMPPVTRRSSDGYVASGNKLTFSMGCPAEPRREDVEYTATETEVRILATDSQTGIQSTLVMVKR